MDRLACPCCGVNLCTPELVMALTDLEEVIGPVAVTSGYRCQAHNDALRVKYLADKQAWEAAHASPFPGAQPAEHSQHLLGKAVDFLCKKEDQARAIVEGGRAGFRGVGIAATWLHMDVRPGVAACWRY
jgi:uncharacterized protein YcbK (DUF882 family)